MANIDLLLRTSDFTNMTVIAEDTGKQLGMVSDVVVDNKNHLLAFLMNSDDPNEAQAFKFKDVKEIIGRTVFVKSAANVSSAKNTVKFDEGKTNSLVKKKLMTKDGKELGLVEDFYFDAKTGSAKEVEYSANGKMSRVASDKIEVKEDTIQIQPKEKESGANPIEEMVTKIKEKLA